MLVNLALMPVIAVCVGMVGSCMFSCCDSSCLCSGGCGTIGCLPPVEVMVLFFPAIYGGVGGFIISGGVGCFIFSGGIGSSGFLSVCRFSRDGSGCSLRGKHVAVLSVVSVLAIYLQ